MTGNRMSLVRLADLYEGLRDIRQELREEGIQSKDVTEGLLKAMAVVRDTMARRTLI